jgi:MFS family permease
MEGGRYPGITARADLCRVRDALSFWRANRAVRPFFIAQAQGAIGDGAGYVALLLLAYDRLGSAWAATALTLADFGPAMLLGPLLGALVDRHGRLRSAIVSDLIRAVAFAGLLVVHGAAGMVALALLAGLGTALFRPATGALLPTLTTRERLGAANALVSMLRDGGQLLGPALAAGLLLVAGPDTVLGFNAVTFVISALLLTRLRGRVRPVAPAEADEPDTPGWRVVLGDVRARVLLITSGVVTLAGGTLNVSELALSQHDLQAGGTGLALLIGAMGVGLTVGSGLGGVSRDLLGLVLVAVGMLGAALAPVLVLTVLAFAVLGAGNGIFFVSNRVMLQRQVAEHLHGRAFGLVSSVDSWGVCAAVVLGGVLVATLGARPTLAIAGAAMTVIALVSRRALRAPAPPAPRLALAQ